MKFRLAKTAEHAEIGWDFGVNPIGLNMALSPIFHAQKPEMYVFFYLLVGLVECS